MTKVYCASMLFFNALLLQLGLVESSPSSPPNITSAGQRPSQRRYKEQNKKVVRGTVMAVYLAGPLSLQAHFIYKCCF